ncbi:MAG: GNAT family N-acetyltransferase [Limnochordia bacterium]
MVHVDTVTDDQTLAQSLAVRRKVFVEEQGVSTEIEYDGLDAIAKHVVAWLDDQVVGTARLVAEGQVGRVGRMAVLPEFRGQGVGGKLLSAVVAIARGEGLVGVYVHAQVHAADFYQRFGFVAEGEEFMEAGIPHIRMITSFSSLGEASS